MVKSKLIIGFLTLAIGTLVGSAGVATTMATNHTMPNPPATKADCKNGGWQHHTDQNGTPFTNQGQCISWVNQHGYGGGGGGGGINIIIVIITTIANNIGNVISSILHSIFHLFG